MCQADTLKMGHARQGPLWDTSQPGPITFMLSAPMKGPAGPDPFDDIETRDGNICTRGWGGGVLSLR